MKDWFNSEFKTPVVYKNGPLPNGDRSLKDCSFCFLLVSVLMGFLAIALYSFIMGNPLRLVQGYDPDHRACGLDSDVKDYPYIYFTTPNPKYLYRTVCVHSCPHKNDVLLDCAPNSVITNCLPNFSSEPNEQVVIYDSVLFGNRVCIPVDQYQYQQVSSQMQFDKILSFWNDIKTSKYVLLATVIFAFFISVGFVYLLDYCGEVVVWSFFALIFTTLLSLSGFSYYQYSEKIKVQRDHDNQQQETKKDDANKNVDSTNVDPNLYLVSSLVLLVIAFVFLAVVVCIKRRIKLTIAILKAGSEFVEQNKSLIRVPLIVFLLQITFFGLWLVTGLYLYSCGQVSQQHNSLPFGQFEVTNYQIYMGCYLFFAGFWITAFLMASVEFITSGCVANWYFQQGKSSEHVKETLSGVITRYFHFHMGSVALGSFVIGILHIFSLICSLIESARRYTRGSSTGEGCLSFANKNAYTQINITGKSFFKAAKDAARLMARNAVEFASILTLGEVFVALGRYTVSMLSSVFAYIVILNFHGVKDNLVFPDAPVYVAGILGFVIGSLFMTIYGIGIGAILHIFCMDQEMESHFGKQQAALCPPALQRFLDEQSAEIR